MISRLNFYSISKIANILSVKQKKKSFVVLLLVIINSLVDVLGLAFILPVIYLINDPSIIYSNSFIKTIFEFLGFSSNTTGFISLLMISLVTVFIVKNAIGIYINYYQNKFAQNLAVNLINKQYKAYLNKDYLFFKNTNSNFIIRDIATIPTDFAHGIIIPLINLSTELLVVLFITLGIAIYNLNVLILIMVILLPGFILFYRLIQNKIEHYGRDVNEVRSKTFKTIFEAIFGIQEVKLSNKEQYFIDRSYSPLSFYYGIFVKLNVLKNAPQRIIECTAIIGLALLYFYYSASGEINELFNTLIIFATASYRLMPSMSRIMTALIDMKNKSYVFDTLTVVNEPIIGSRDLEHIKFNKTIELKNISFQYPNQKKGSINNLNFSINKGAFVGIRGESGCGKSTLLKIMCRLIIENSGDFLIDGAKLNKSNNITWRKKIGYVQQDFYLLDATLAENIAFGEELNAIDINKLNECIELSKLSELIKTLPEGIDTNIGEFGGNLSGGQRQRIAIARALYKDSEILLFDEATSALDDNTEHEIIDTIKSLKKNNYTIIMIAHRINSMDYCDVIYTMEDGEIKE